MTDVESMSHLDLADSAANFTVLKLVQLRTPVMDFTPAEHLCVEEPQEIENPGPHQFWNGAGAELEAERAKREKKLAEDRRRRARAADRAPCGMAGDSGATAAATGATARPARAHPQRSPTEGVVNFDGCAQQFGDDSQRDEGLLARCNLPTLSHMCILLSCALQEALHMPPQRPQKWERTTLTDCCQRAQVCQLNQSTEMSRQRA